MWSGRIYKIAGKLPYGTKSNKQLWMGHWVVFLSSSSAVSRAEKPAHVPSQPILILITLILRDVLCNRLYHGFLDPAIQRCALHLHFTQWGVNHCPVRNQGAIPMCVLYQPGGLGYKLTKKAGNWGSKKLWCSAPADGTQGHRPASCTRGS